MEQSENIKPKIPIAAFFGIFYAAAVMLLVMSLLYVVSIGAGTVIYCSLISTIAILMIAYRKPTPPILIPICIIAAGNVLIMLFDIRLIISEIAYCSEYGNVNESYFSLFLMAAVLIYSIAHIAWGIHSTVAIVSNKNSIVSRLWFVPSVLLGISLTMAMTALIPYGYLFLQAGVSPTSIMLVYGTVIICIVKFFFVFFTSRWLYSHTKNK